MKQNPVSEEEQYKRMGKLMFPAVWEEIVITVQQMLLKDGINVYIDHPDLAVKMAYTILMAIDRKAREKNKSLQEIFRL